MSYGENTITLDDDGTTFVVTVGCHCGNNNTAYLTQEELAKELADAGQVLLKAADHDDSVAAAVDADVFNYGWQQGRASTAAGPWIPVTAGLIPEDVDLLWWAPNWGAKVGAIMSQAAVDRNGGRGVAGGVYPGGGSVSGYSHWAEMRKP